MNPIRISTLLALAAAALLTGCNSGSSGPPRVGLDNDSDCVARVTFWVGDRTPSGPVALRSDRTVEVSPGRREHWAIGDNAHFVSPTESFVRIQIEIVGASFEKPVQYWFELNPPPPYVVQIVGSRPDFEFERDGDPTGSTMIMVPREHWVPQR